jgi:hypothetical protein
VSRRSASRTPRPAAARPAPRPPARASVPPLPLRHPAAWLAIGAAALSIVLSVSYVLYDKDLWQHLAVGRAIWTLREVPVTQIWVWPTYGTPDVTPSWLFRVLLWPLWQAGGVPALFAWRWGTTHAAFGLAWWTARRMGARGLTPLLVMAVCALTYRQRSQIRPETLVAVLLAAQIALLEARRHGARDLTWLLVPIAWLWLNAHISWPLGLALTAIHLVALPLDRRRGAANAHAARRLALVLAGQAVASVLHPGGLPALRQPFEYVLAGRNEPIMKTIPELFPIPWHANLADLLPLVLGGWLLLALGRWRRHGFDAVEALTAGGFVALAIPSQRFLGFAMIALAPYLARDLDGWVAERAWPAWTRPAWTRAGLLAFACLATGPFEWLRPDMPLGVAYDWRQLPIRACDFMERHGVRGRGFNPFYLGGYLLHRFWPERERLPFMDIHQSGTPLDRYRYAFVGFEPRAWRDLDGQYRFDWVLWRRTGYGSERLLDRLDADTSFTLVFLDDAAALWVRTHGPLAPLARARAYRAIPAGPARWRTLHTAAARDPALRTAVVRELEREMAGSPGNALASLHLGDLARAAGDLPAARRHYQHARAVDPRTPGLAEAFAALE